MNKTQGCKIIAIMTLLILCSYFVVSGVILKITWRRKQQKQEDHIRLSAKFDNKIIIAKNDV